MLAPSDRLSRFSMVVAAALTFVLAVVMLADALSEAMTGRALTGSAEIVGNAVVMIVFLQAAHAVRCRSLNRSDFMLSLMPWPMRRVALAAGYAIGMLLFAAIAAANWTPMMQSFGHGVLAPVARLAIVFGAALAAINYVVLAYIDLTRPEPTVESEIAELRRLDP